MSVLAAIIRKDLLLLLRDRTALLLLFIMPAALAVVITLVQENVFKTVGGVKLEGLLVDHDGGAVAEELVRHFEEMEELSLGRAQDERTALLEVEDGEVQFLIVLPIGTTETIREGADQLIGSKTKAGLTLYTDPTLSAGFKSALRAALERALMLIEIDFRTEALLGVRLDQGGLFEVDSRDATRGGYDVLPTSVQQTVPAMAIFGIFFIVVPLAGALVRERRSGTFSRVMIAPVSRLAFVAGKLAAYSLVCLCQFALILLMGMTLLPLLGTPRLVLGNDLLAIGTIALCSSLAACGFGILLGSVSRTSEQATTTGPISVVIAAALGGIMVPVFVMPKSMQALSRFSPLEWGHHALLDIFVRGGSLATVWPQMVLLLLFFVATLGLAGIALSRRF
jgi:ABC-2 type transport system permease protein